ncbi:hypothetical protein BV25DRAFT_1357538 [Artomyces pyxidatus]|uniref:Uncharacterized protein n=1 Tax=Artomyces pyxidatus TaxID=48021 RepID=A0ACB8SNV1_9AGAM|nr:hypothetical protein BV25DRAFT_1357538 [Artomyces pyxidatus]
MDCQAVDSPGIAPETGPTKSLGFLGTLPNELIYAIFDEIHSLQDIISFCLAHKRLEQVGRRTLDNIHAIYPEWAGKRVICVGDYVEDLPDDVLTEEEEEEIAEQGGLYSVAKREYLALQVGIGFPYAERSFVRRLPRDEQIRFIQLETPYFPADREWVLCNLTTREYVRADAVAKLGGYKSKGPIGDMNVRVGLGTALLSRICWTADRSGSYLSYDILDGEWAGHRFEITTIERMEGGQNAKWTDVSEEVVEELRDLYKAEARSGVAFL